VDPAPAIVSTVARRTYATRIFIISVPTRE
jgi:hypothetical protein